MEVGDSYTEKGTGVPVTIVRLNSLQVKVSSLLILEESWVPIEEFNQKYELLE